MSEILLNRTPTLFETKVISRPEQKYCGWPTLTRRRNGELLAVCSGGRSRHVCPDGRVHFLRSRDEGLTWSDFSVLSAGPLDDRDSAMMENAQGDLIVTWFSSVAYEFQTAANRGDAYSLKPEEIEQRQKLRDSLDDEVRLAELGCWSRLSEDGGLTWSPKIRTVVGSPHGPILLQDGRLLYVGKFQGQGVGLKGGPFEGRIGAAESLDGGRSWQELSEIRPMTGHDASEYHEPHAVQAEDGRIIAHIRNHREPQSKELLQTESIDGGRTWTPVRSTGLWGFPSHLQRLSNGSILASYSHRREPRGNRCAVSSDQGATWSEPLLLTADGGPDFGYPSTVELTNGDLATLWYERKSDEVFASLRLLRWRLNG